MAGIIEAIPASLDEIVYSTLLKGEAVIFCLKGQHKEALVCTDNRIIIAKTGFWTSRTFSSDIFQLSYTSISSAHVKFGLLRGYFEALAAGVRDRNTNRANLFNTNRDPRRAPNCVSLNSSTQAHRFRQAASFIMDQKGDAKPDKPDNDAAAHSGADVAASLEKVWTLKGQGALTEDEYQAAKASLLAGR